MFGTSETDSCFIQLLFKVYENWYYAESKWQQDRGQKNALEQGGKVFLVFVMNYVEVPEWVSLQPSSREEKRKKKESWRQQCSFSSVSSNSSAWYQSLKCLAVVILWTHNTAKINSFSLQQKDRKINTGSKTATTFFSTLKKNCCKKWKFTDWRKKWRCHSLVLEQSRTAILFATGKRLAISKVQCKIIYKISVQNARKYSTKFIF